MTGMTAFADFAALCRALEREPGRRGKRRFTAAFLARLDASEIAAAVAFLATYPSGLALRFARIARIREDKAPGQATTLDELRHLYERQFGTKGRPM